MGKAQKLKLARQEAPKLKLDFGCGKHPREGFEGVDKLAFGQKYSVDLTDQWPWDDASVEEAHSSHFIEHLRSRERVHFVNELYRVLVPGGKCQIIAPHWASCRAYGDMTHQWPPISEFWFFYLSKEWREQNAPHDDIANSPDGYSCDFDVTWGYSLHQGLMARNIEYQQHALTYWKEAAQDVVATLGKKVNV